MRNALLIAAVAFFGACLGWAIKPAPFTPPYPLVVEYRTEVEKESTKPPVFFDAEPEVVFVEKEPTPHPTDCVAMKWLE